MKRFLATLIILFIATPLFSQNELVDTELWSGLAVKMKVNKKWKIELEEQIRFKDSIKTLKSSFTELSARYKINKQFSLKAGYRYSIRYGYRQRNRNRMALFLYYNFERDELPISIQIRSGFQNDIEDYNGQLLSYSRNRIKVNYNPFKDVESFFSYESFYRFNSKNEFRTNRFTGGLSLEINKALDLTGFYRVEQEINVDEPERQHIIGLMLTYSFKY